MSESGRIYMARWQRAGRYDFDDMLVQSCPPRVGSSLLIRKTAFDSAGFFDTEVRSAQDLDMWLRIQRDSHMPFFWGNSAYLLDIRVRPGAISRDHRARFESLDALIGKYAERLQRYPREMAYVRAAVFAYRASEDGFAVRWASLGRQAGLRSLIKDSYGWRLLGLLALAVGAGLQVMQALMEADVTELAGAKGRHDSARSAVRHGRERGSVTLGGRRVPVSRPRVRAADGSGELPIASYELFSSTEILGKMAMEKMLAGLSTRRYPVGLEPVGAHIAETSSATSRSAVSRKFVAMTETALAELLSRDLSGLDLVALIIDGVHFAESCCVVALGIDIEGNKHPLALVEGSTENATLVTGLLVDLRERGLDVTRSMLVGLDGSKALRKAVVDVLDRPVIQRCQIHKVRNVKTICRNAFGPVWAAR